MLLVLFRYIHYLYLIYLLSIIANTIVFEYRYSKKYAILYKLHIL